MNMEQGMLSRFNSTFLVFNNLTKLMLKLLTILIFTFPFCLMAQSPNYDESQVPAYDLPDLLKFENGKMVQNQEDWQKKRRKEILRLFEEEMFGQLPTKKVDLSFETLSEDQNALGGKAIRKEVRGTIQTKNGKVSFDILIYLPKAAKVPAPTFLALNFYGNHSIHPDPDISLSKKWMMPNEKFGIIDNRATEASRGVRISRWPVEEILKRGYGLATIYYGDFDPDFHDEFQNGLHPLFYKKGQSQPKKEEWGAIGAWAYGLSRAMDYLQTDSQIDGSKIILMGHSRLGKAALYAGALDQRFSIVISNNSGCGGAALSKRKFGETLKVINDRFPHWFCENFKKYNDKEEQLPFDQHMLIALMAPRPVYVASASEDQWADPRGEFLAALHASPVYRLFGKTGLSITEMPTPDQHTTGGYIGYHLRKGKHDVTLYDWERYMDFADRHWGKPK